MKEYTFNISGNTYNVVVNSVSGDTANVTVNGVNYQVGLQAAPAAQTVPQACTAPVPAEAPAPSASPVTSPSPAPAVSGEGTAVTSPLPGVIIAIKVKVGDTVSVGQEIAVLEAMKMENSIEATKSGTVTAIHAAQGDSVLEGAAIVTIQ